MPLFKPSSGGVTAHSALTGLSADDHTQYSINTPGTAARNTLTPTANVVTTTYVAAVGQTAAQTEWYKSDGTTLIAKVFSGSGQTRMQIGGAGYAATLGNAVLHVISDLSSQQAVRFIGRAAYGATSGAGIQGLADAGSAVTSGARLGYFLVGGARDAINTLANQAGFEFFATENWSGTANGCEIRFETTPNTTVTRKVRLTMANDGSLAIGNADAVPGTPASGGVFYIAAGALHYLGSAGTDTIIAPA